jgi:glycosyltransferase involved in cell wall biosynthesis
VTGILVKAEDHEAVAQAIIRLHQDTHFYQTIVENARNRAKKLFNQQRTVTLTEQFYQKLS